MANVDSDIGNRAGLQRGAKGTATWIGRLFAAIGIEIKSRSHRHSRLQLIETLQLGGRRQLMLVLCDEQEYLVAAGPDSVHSITPTRPTAIAASEPSIRQGRVGLGSHDTLSLPTIPKRRFSF